MTKSVLDKQRPARRRRNRSPKERRVRRDAIAAGFVYAGTLAALATAAVVDSGDPCTDFGLSAIVAGCFVFVALMIHDGGS